MMCTSVCHPWDIPVIRSSLCKKFIFGNELELIEALRLPATVHNCLIGYQSQSFSYNVGFKIPVCL